MHEDVIGQYQILAKEVINHIQVLHHEVQPVMDHLYLDMDTFITKEVTVALYKVILGDILVFHVRAERAVNQPYMYDLYVLRPGLWIEKLKEAAGIIPLPPHYQPIDDSEYWEE